MHMLMRALAQNVDQSRCTAHELKLETVEQLLTLASLELSTRLEIIEQESRLRPRRTV